MKKILVCILLFFIIFGKVVVAQDDNFKALFMYNITNFIEWPAAEGVFKIQVLGSSQIVKIFTTDAKLKDKKVAGIPIDIKEISDVGSVDDCHILYISETKGDQIDAAVSAVEGKPILIVTHSDGAIDKGACINFYKQASGKLSMQISRKNIEKHGLKVDSKLLYLGEEVN